MTNLTQVIVELYVKEKGSVVIGHYIVHKNILFLLTGQRPSKLRSHDINNMASSVSLNFLAVQEKDKILSNLTGSCFYAAVAYYRSKLFNVLQLQGLVSKMQLQTLLF